MNSKSIGEEAEPLFVIVATIVVASLMGGPLLGRLPDPWNSVALLGGTVDCLVGMVLFFRCHFKQWLETYNDYKGGIEGIIESVFDCLMWAFLWPVALLRHQRAQKASLDRT